MADESSPPPSRNAIHPVDGVTDRSARSMRVGALPATRRRAPEALGQEITRRIEAMILDGRLRPGERLNEVTLARDLGVSRGPVREAARALEKTGLVTVIMNRGGFVRSLTLAEAMDIYEINATLFGLAARNAAGALTAPQAARLRTMVDAMDTAIARAARAAFFQVNSDFHAFIMACGGNAEAAALYAQLTQKLRLLRQRSFEHPGHMQDANREHRALMDAILAGRPVAARNRAEAHARLGRTRFLEAIGRGQPSRTISKEGAT
jgi:DNA-binding GntR family transcriptional regulator